MLRKVFGLKCNYKVKSEAEKMAANRADATDGFQQIGSARKARVEPPRPFGRLQTGGDTTDSRSHAGRRDAREQDEVDSIKMGQPAANSTPRSGKADPPPVRSAEANDGGSPLLSNPDNYRSIVDKVVQDVYELRLEQTPAQTVAGVKATKVDEHVDVGDVRLLVGAPANSPAVKTPVQPSEKHPADQATVAPEKNTSCASSSGLVKTSDTMYAGPNVYRMAAQPRGFCVIINNVNFDVDCFEVRNGSDREADFLRDVYRQLGFQVKNHKNLCTNMMLRVLRSYSKSAELAAHDAFVCIILTHGDSRVLVGSDGLFITVETVVGCFNNYHCPALVNKPKLFFIQACRGGCRDYGVISPGTVADAVPRPLSAISPSVAEVIPTWTDTLIVYSTLEGFVSLRNERSGSWFGDALGKALVEHACDMDIYQLLMEVNKNIVKRENSGRVKQAIECIFRGWNKQLYFNPGHPVAETPTLPPEPAAEAAATLAVAGKTSS